MEINYVDPPNRPMSSAFAPATEPILYKDVVFMDFDDDGRMLVGTANVTGTYWESSLQIFADYQNYQQEKYQSYYNSSIIFDGKFLPNNKQIIAESESKLKILALPEGLYEPKPVWADCAEHHEAIKQIAQCDDKEKILTVSDSHITQWDLADGLQVLWDFTDYHTNKINAIDTKKQDSNMFVSVGDDKRACLWDIRMESVAMELYFNEFCSLTSVAWCKENLNLIVVGTQAGNLYLIDVQQPKDFLNIQHCYKKAIQKLQFNHSQLAVVGKTNELKVYNCKENEFNLSYKDSEKHKKIICDVKWYKGSCFTGGFDNNIVKHSF